METPTRQRPVNIRTGRPHKPGKQYAKASRSGSVRLGKAIARAMRQAREHSRSTVINGVRFGPCPDCGYPRIPGHMSYGECDPTR